MVIIKIDKLPEGSRIEKYSEQLANIIRSGDDKAFDNFMKDVFKECEVFLKTDLKGQFFPIITLYYVYNRASYNAIRKQAEQNAIQKETAKGRSSAFVVGNRFNKKIYLDMKAFLDLLQQHGCPTFIYNLIETYIHELLHCIYHNKKSEQEVHDIQCGLVEKFLGIPLPDEAKNMNSSDYYETPSENSTREA